MPDEEKREAEEPLKLSPFERKKYKKSFYYRDLGKKYSWGITKDFDYLLYECAKELGLSMERCVYFAEEEKNEEFPYYVWEREKETVVILFPIFESVYYDHKEQRWAVNCDEDGLNLKEAVENSYGDLVKQFSYPVKLLLEEGVFDDYKKVKEEPFFLVSGKCTALQKALSAAAEGGLRWTTDNEGEQIPENRGAEPQ